MEKRKKILRKVKDHIDTELNLFISMTQQQMILKKRFVLRIWLIHSKSQHLSMKQHYLCHNDNDFQLHLNKSPNSCFVNNYFSEEILAWEANLDIQPVFNHYKVIGYMCVYLSKSEDECTQAMSQAVKDAFEKKSG